MKLEEQVLSIKQIRELQELGFDVKKHSSIKSNGKKVVTEDDFYIGVSPLYPTMTIGDIINVLPFKIDTHYFLSINSEYCAYSMSGDFDTIFFTREKEIMNNLFKTLVWCIKEKHIKL